MNAAIKKGRSSLDVAQHIVKYCADSGINNSLSPMQLLKLVYLCHGWMLGIHGRPLISEEVEAWTYGPVIPDLYHAIKQFRSGVIDTIKGAQPVQLDDEELRVINQVCGVYGQRTGMELSQLTHKAGSPWDVTWVNRGKSGVMPNDVIEAHYRNLAQKQAA